jgi:hypothetical protein
LVPNGAQFARLNQPRCPTRYCHPASIEHRKENDMAKGEQKGNREAKKPKKQQVKTIAAAPSQKGAGWQPGLAAGKKK